MVYTGRKGGYGGKEGKFYLRSRKNPKCVTMDKHMKNLSMNRFFESAAYRRTRDVLAQLGTTPTIFGNNAEHGGS